MFDKSCGLKEIISMKLRHQLDVTRLRKNEIAIFWLGQAGFIIKDYDENIVVIDPYLTDCGERIRGFKRLTPKLLSPGELEPDIYINTHIHFDHFDFDAVPIVSSCPWTKFFGPQTCVDKYLELGIKKERVSLLGCGTEITEKNIMIKAVFADHGRLAPEAIGILLNINGIKLYFSGDTAYRPEMIKDVIDFAPDIAILSVNGKFGNLNSEEGAKLASDIGAKIAIPCHYWMFKEHGGDPQLFEEEMKKHSPQCLTKFMCQGEMFRYSL
jgi:L-ascorbate 6-phosphate lactonase